MIDIVVIQETHRMIKGIEKKQRFISNLSHGSGIGEFECFKPRGRTANLAARLDSVDGKHDFVVRSTFIIQDAFADKARKSMIIHCLRKFIFKQINFNFPMSKTIYAHMLIDIIREEELPALISVYRAMLNISQSMSFVPPPERVVHEIYIQESQLQFLLDQTLTEILEDLRLNGYSEIPEAVTKSCPYQKDLHENNRHSCEGCVGTNCKRLAEIGYNDDWATVDSSLLPTCGAKTRAGHCCRKKIIPGKRRCRFHGGLSTGPKTIEGRRRIREAQLCRWATKRHKNIVPTERANIPSPRDPNKPKSATMQLRISRKARKISPMAL